VLYETSPTDIDQVLKSFAQELGITDMARISPINIPVEDWVLLKCQYGCPNYRRRLTCPPYSPEPSRTRTILGDYSMAFLLRYDVPTVTTEADMKIQEDGLIKAWEAFLRLEQFSFLNGYNKAFVFGLNHCPGCHTCAAESGEILCKHPLQARPSLEACGINVQKLTGFAGWTGRLKGQNIMQDDNNISLISLLLLE